MTETFYADDAAAQAAFQLPPDFSQGTTFEPHEETPPAAAQAPEPVVPEEDVPEFDPKFKQPFTGLLYVGALTKTFELYGHSFTIASPTQTERLQMGQVIEPFQGTVTGEIAYQSALVAAYLVDIDGKKLPQAIMIDPKETALHDRFKWVNENLRRPVIDKIFEECLVLDSKVDEVLEAMGKASG
jgi:hypothetical protein